jgi:hypothetical protein
MNRGHYFAEAMDWSTGLWFRFDDETVTHISEGPMHSIEKSSTGKQGDHGLSGSQDAFRLLYVKSSFLFQVKWSYLLSGDSSRMSNQIMKKEQTERYVWLCICFKNSGLHSNGQLNKTEIMFLVT